MVNRKNPLKLGIVGCGRVTDTLHLPALQGLPQAEVVAVSDIDSDRLKSVADHFQVKNRFTDYRSLLDDGLIEAVAVCVPAQLHIEVALAALEAGKHVFIEKPLALSLGDCDRLIEKAKTVNKRAMVGFNLRYHRLVCEARKIIQQGVLGPIDAIRSNWTSAVRFHQNVPAWRNRRELGGGALFEIAVHHFDLFCFLIQSEIDEIYALSKSEQWADETVTITARLRNGVVATSVFSERTADTNEVEIYGRTGRLRVSLYRFDGLEFSSTSTVPGSIMSRFMNLVHVLKELPKGVSIMRHGGDFIMSYRYEWQHFTEAIQNDRPVESSLEDGRRALQIVLAATESANVGKPVKICPDP
jgi:predicted dehydrogenase